jgi:hypothetical protein
MSKKQMGFGSAVVSAMAGTVQDEVFARWCFEMPRWDAALVRLALK